VTLVRERELRRELPQVKRRLGPRDREREARAREREEKALRLCREKIRQMGLDMQPVEARFYPPGRMVIYFVSEKRVDFRRLAQELARALRARVEMRQVGVRDRSRLVGGVGPCGRELCCSSFLTRFEPVSIRLAKAQGLSLSPTRVSGVCGRLMCCLRYEVHEGECAGCGRA
jgi:cell fate regulator YaaT (PSP1 superfamily)